MENCKGKLVDHLHCSCKWGFNFCASDLSSYLSLSSAFCSGSSAVRLSLSIYDAYVNVRFYLTQNSSATRYALFCETVPAEISCFHDYGQELALSLLYYFEIGREHLQK